MIHFTPDMAIPSKIINVMILTMRIAHASFQFIRPTRDSANPVQYNAVAVA